MSLHIRWEAAKDSIGQLLRQPFASLMTVLALGITLSLPVGLYAMLGNVERLLGSWQDQAQVSLFLKDSTTAAQALALQRQLSATRGVVHVRYVDQAQALAEFKRHSGFGPALDALGENPLPASLVVNLDPVRYPPATLQGLVTQWGQNPLVAVAQSDLHWVSRLHALIALGQRAVLILAVLLGLGVVLVMGNTIRLHIVNRRDEIDVASLVGASRSFIRRPFLYQGLLQGALAGLLSWAIVAAAFLLLQKPIDTVAGLYGSRFTLYGLDPSQGLGLVAVAAALGWLGSLIAVSRHLYHTVQ